MLVAEVLLDVECCLVAPLDNRSSRELADVVEDVVEEWEVRPPRVRIRGAAGVC